MTELKVRQLYSIPHGEITVSDRDRKDYGNVEELALDIRQNGLLQPISINQEGRLIGGGRRLKAWKLNHAQYGGEEKIPVYVTFAGTDMEVKIKEFGENFHRKEMSWQETAVSVYLLTKKQQAIYGEAKQGARTDIDNKKWGLKDTARVLCIQHVQVIRYIAAIKAFYDGHTDVLERDSLYSALQLVKDRREVEALERIEELTIEEEEIDDYDNTAGVQPGRAGATQEITVDGLGEGEDILEDENALDPITHPKTKRPLQSEFASVLEGDACELIKDIKPEMFDCILWDPPFGIELGKKLKAKGREVYHDTAEYYTHFMEVLLPEFYRVMKPDSHIYVFHGPDMFEYTKQSMKKAGFEVDKIPWIWNKINIAGQSIVPDRWPGRVYEPILFGHKGHRPMLQKGRRNVLNIKTVAPQRKRHPTQKPVLLYRALLQNSVRTGEIVLDPMAGSGSSLIACAISGIKAIGFEADRGHFLKIKSVLKEELFRAKEIEEETVPLDEWDDIGGEIENPLALDKDEPTHPMDRAIQDLP